MFIIYKLTNPTLTFIKPFLLLGLKLHYYETHNIQIERIHKIKNIQPLKFNQKSVKSKKVLRKYDYGEKSYINSYISKYIPIVFFLNKKNKFKNIENIQNKLELIFISKLNYHDIGAIDIYCDITKNKKIFLLHTNFHSFICKNNGVNLGTNIIHIYLPIDDFYTIFRTIKNTIRKKINNIFNNNLFRKDYLEKKPNLLYKKIAIIYHDSTNYGPLYKKDHYFSTNKNSFLFKKNVTKFVLGNNKNDKVSLINLNYQFKYNDILIFLKYLLLEFRFCRNLNQLYGLILINLFFLRYKYWREFFKKTKIKNVIYDYDILMSKSIAFA